MGIPSLSAATRFAGLAAEEENEVICMNDHDRRKQAVKNAEASLRMEGLRGSPEMEKAVYEVLDGQMTEETYLAEVFRRVARKRN